MRTINILKNIKFVEKNIETRINKKCFYKVSGML